MLHMCPHVLEAAALIQMGTAPYVQHSYRAQPATHPVLLHTVRQWVASSQCAMTCVIASSHRNAIWKADAAEFIIQTYLYTCTYIIVYCIYTEKCRCIRVQKCRWCLLCQLRTITTNTLMIIPRWFVLNSIMQEWFNCYMWHLVTHINFILHTALIIND